MILAFLFGLQTCSAADQSESPSSDAQITDLLKKVNDFYRQRNFNQAYPLLEKCLQLQVASLGSNHVWVADTLFISAAMRREQGRLIEAVPLFHRCLAIREKELGRDHPAVATTLVSLALIYKKLQNYSLAIPLLERSLAIHETISKDKPDVIASVLVNLSEFYRFQRDYAKATDALQRCLAINEKLHGADSLAVANCIHKLALVSEDQGDYATAASLFRRGLEIRDRKRGKPDDDYAICLRDVAEFYRRRGQVTQSLNLCLRSLELLEKSGELEGPKGAGVLSGLTRFYREQGNYAAALTALQHCQAILETAHGKEHPRVAQALGDLANLRADMGDYREALALHQRSFGIYEKAYGPEHAEVAVSLINLAEFHHGQGDFARALELSQRGFAILEQALGPEHPEVSAALNNLGSLQMDLGNYGDALAFLKRSLAIKEKAFGLKSLDVAIALNNLAELFDTVGDFGLAAEFYEESLSITREALGEESPLVATILSNLSLVYQRQGKLPEALQIAQRSLAVREKLRGPEHPDVGVSLNNLAEIYLDLGEFQRASQLHLRNLRIREKFLGPNHPDVVLTLHNLATVFLVQGDTPNGIRTFRRAFDSQRSHLLRNLGSLPGKEGLRAIGLLFYRAEMFHTACAEGTARRLEFSRVAGAEHLALNKGLLEEVQTTRSALEQNQDTKTGQLHERYNAVLSQLRKLQGTGLQDLVAREELRHRLQDQLQHVESQLADRVRLVGDTVRGQNVTLIEIGRGLPHGAAVVDFIHYRRFDFTAKSNQWQEARYAAYLTFPLAKDATNFVVERVDLGEAAPINEAVAHVGQLMADRRIAPKLLQPALARLSDLVWSPLTRHLTNASHLILCPDGQLSRVPFEMLPLGSSGKYLIEEKSVSYVSSGREVARLAPGQPGSKAKVQSSKSLVMGNPDFDLDLSDRSSRREEAHSLKPEADQSLLTSAATMTTRSLSRSYRGIKFTPLPAAETEARSIAKLLGDDCVLRLGAAAREAELKAVVSPRVLHLATHGFFLTDQEFKRTNSASDGLLLASATSGTPGWQAGRPPYFRSPEEQWENPLVRCGIALAGANRATRVTNAVAEDGLLTGLEASLLNLQGTELVILSACQSGSGEVKIGEGVMSLRRAFTIAGAESVLASHWPVSDRATSQLMTEFMRRWRGGEPRVQAWRAAQLSLLRSKDFASPYFWAAFTLTGQWR